MAHIVYSDTEEKVKEYQAANVKHVYVMYVGTSRLGENTLPNKLFGYNKVDLMPLFDRIVKGLLKKYPTLNAATWHAKITGTSIVINVQEGDMVEPVTFPLNVSRNKFNVKVLKGNKKIVSGKYSFQYYTIQPVTDIF